MVLLLIIEDWDDHTLWPLKKAVPTVRETRAMATAKGLCPRKMGKVEGGDSASQKEALNE